MFSILFSNNSYCFFWAFLSFHRAICYSLEIPILPAHSLILEIQNCLLAHVHHFIFIHIRLNPSLGCLVTQSLRSFCNSLPSSLLFTALGNLVFLLNAVEATEVSRSIYAAVCTWTCSWKSIYTLKAALLSITTCGPVSEVLMVFISACSIH